MCKQKIECDKPDKHDEAMVVRASKGLMMFFLLGLMACAVLLVSVFVKPEGFREQPLTPGELLGARIVFGLGVPLMFYYLLDLWRFRLILAPYEIVCRELFSLRRFPIGEIEKLEYVHRKCSSGTIKIYPKGQKKYQLDAFLVNDSCCFLRYLRETIPLEKQVGWEEYYRRNRFRMVQPLNAKQFSGLKQHKALLLAVLAMAGLLGLLVLVASIGFWLVHTPWCFSGFLVFLFFTFCLFLFWPRRERKNEEVRAKPCSKTIKVFTVLFSLYVLFLGLAAIWDWLPSQWFHLIASYTFLGVGLGGGIGVPVFLHREGKQNATERKLAREAEEAKYEEYAELLLPPELEE